VNSEQMNKWILGNRNIYQDKQQTFIFIHLKQ
jgi:hypothetical protein